MLTVSISFLMFSWSRTKVEWESRATERATREFLFQRRLKSRNLRVLWVLFSYSVSTTNLFCFDFLPASTMRKNQTSVSSVCNNITLHCTDQSCRPNAKVVAFTHHDDNRNNEQSEKKKKKMSFGKATSVQDEEDRSNIVVHPSHINHDDDDVSAVYSSSSI